MDYNELRFKFCQITGRLDLVTTSLASTALDNGADFFLNAGQKYLDRLIEKSKMIARYPVIVTAGTFLVNTIGLRSIHEVWIANSEGKVRLSQETLTNLKNVYGEDFSSITQGTPKYYAPAIFRPFPDTLASTTGMYGVDDLLLYSATSPAQHYNYHGLVICPPPDETYTVEVVGLFHSPTLSATLSGAVWTNVKSYWTEVHPETLIAAAAYKLLSLYHDTTGAADYKNTVIEDVLGINGDVYEEEMGSYIQMEG